MTSPIRSHGNVLGMFVKAWNPGQVKTRLAAEIGADAAAAIYHYFVNYLVDRLGQTSWELDRVLEFTPAEEIALFRPLEVSRWRLHPQREGDLGQRIAGFFHARLETEGYSKAILIGSDSPDLPLDRYEETLNALDHHDIVFVPSEDGGYCLIGMSVWQDTPFQGIAWSTSSVLDQTLQKLDSQGIRYALLPPWYDVDTLQDLQRLIRSILDASEDSSLRKLGADIQSLL